MYQKSIKVGQNKTWKASVEVHVSAKRYQGSVQLCQLLLQV